MPSDTSINKPGHVNDNPTETSMLIQRIQGATTDAFDKKEKKDKDGKKVEITGRKRERRIKKLLKIPKELNEYVAMVQDYIKANWHIFTQYLPIGDGLDVRPGTGMWFDPALRIASVDTQWFAKVKEKDGVEGYSNEQILFAIFHELSHFKDMMLDANIKGMIEHFERIKKKVIILKDTEGVVRTYGTTGIYHEFYNCVDDVIVNMMVKNLEYFRDPSRRQELIDLYQEKLFVDHIYMGEGKGEYEKYFFVGKEKGSFDIKDDKLTEVGEGKGSFELHLNLEKRIFVGENNGSYNIVDDQWIYTGMGKGDYDKFFYVGDGKGQFTINNDKVEELGPEKGDYITVPYKDIPTGKYVYTGKGNGSFNINKYKPVYYNGYSLTKQLSYSILRGKEVKEQKVIVDKRMKKRMDMPLYLAFKDIKEELKKNNIKPNIRFMVTDNISMKIRLKDFFDDQIFKMDIDTGHYLSASKRYKLIERYIDPLYELLIQLDFMDGPPPPPTSPHLGRGGEGGGGLSEKLEFQVGIDVIDMKTMKIGKIIHIKENGTLVVEFTGEVYKKNTQKMAMGNKGDDIQEYKDPTPNELCVYLPTEDDEDEDEDEDDDEDEDEDDDEDTDGPQIFPPKTKKGKKKPKKNKDNKTDPKNPENGDEGSDDADNKPDKPTNEGDDDKVSEKITPEGYEEFEDSVDSFIEWLKEYEDIQEGEKAEYKAKKGIKTQADMINRRKNAQRKALLDAVPGLTDQMIDAFDILSQKAHPYVNKIGDLWENLIKEVENTYHREEKKWFSKGFELDMDRTVGEYPEIMAGADPDTDLQLYKRMQTIIKQEIQPKTVRLRLLLDVSGSMDEDKRKKLKILMIALALSMLDLKNRMEGFMKKLGIRDPLFNIDTEMRIFGNEGDQICIKPFTMKNIDKFDINIYKGQVIKSLSELDIKKGTFELATWKFINGDGVTDKQMQEHDGSPITKEDKLALKENRLKELMIEVTDGDTFEEGTVTDDEGDQVHPITYQIGVLKKLKAMCKCIRIDSDSVESKFRSALPHEKRKIKENLIKEHRKTENGKKYRDIWKDDGLWSIGLEDLVNTISDLFSEELRKAFKLTNK